MGRLHYFLLFCYQRRNLWIPTELVSDVYCFKFYLVHLRMQLTFLCSVIKVCTVPSQARASITKIARVSLLIKERLAKYYKIWWLINWDQDEVRRNSLILISLLPSFKYWNNKTLNLKLVVLFHLPTYHRLFTISCSVVF